MTCIGQSAQDPCPYCTPCPACHDRRVLPPVKTCANETCRRAFRFQEGGATRGQYRTTGVMFCTVRCANTQNQRDRRRRRRDKAKP